ncbi:hypothetical protein VPNG_07777 [Cytospora leucostoma]|uniref:RZ-type domain-containing protein n=1 Tax=Cytospora leucostoma TaxID=1230097 RepID=A0A423WEG1_9PEZI|nr:hypothetical protein VPNG_07777 [Cytospora leucostoma]
MEGDLGASQETIRLLATDPGLGFIKAITDRHVPDATDRQEKLGLWRTQISLLFRLITHPRVVDSNVLEQEVNGIYTFLLGGNASRMDRLFSFVADVAGSSPDTFAIDMPQMSILESSLAVLSKLVDCCTNNVINDAFHHVVERFEGLIHASTQPQDDYSKLQAIKYLQYLQRRLGIGKNMAEVKSPGKAHVEREAFVLSRDLPGYLSKDGPRHDNDHAEISQINIMPTHQEITSPRSEYLPTTDSSRWHISGIRGRLDREFRLLREDTVGQLRDAVGDLLEHIRSPSGKDHRQSRNSVRTTTYEGAKIQQARLDKDKGLEFTVRCRQPDFVRKMGDQERRLWWDQCNRLQPGALICVLDAAGMVQFLVVADSTLRVSKVNGNRSGTNKDIISQNQRELTLSSDRDSLYVNLNLVSTSNSDVACILRWYREIGSSPQKYLVEFPGVLLASFKYTLEALQQLSKKPDMPFSDLIAPETPSKSKDFKVSPPLFARSAGFAFDLSCLTRDHKELRASIRQSPTTEEVSSMTGLDETQSEALLNSLCREVSLIQGPPGTGKSYTGEKIIKVLLANKAKAKLGPIICVCYTNHALDQLLEHLLDDGINGIIRMGSRSKSERLQDLTLRSVASSADLTRAERRQMWEIGQDLERIEADASRLLAELSQCFSTPAIRRYLSEDHPEHDEELFNKDEHEWQTVTHNRARNVVEQWLDGGDLDPRRAVRNLDVLKSTLLNSMTHAERSRLHRYWLKTVRERLITELVLIQKEHNQVKEQRDRVRQEIRRRCLQQADIVGVTTTGLAREISLLRKLRSKVIICEEAGEVLEAHILTTLLPSVEQAILIGDHLQLRPQIQDYKLQSTNPKGQQYSLDMSLFERLVQPPHSSDLKLPVSVLETQRRMHPSIAEMVRSTLYNTLKNGGNVTKYPPVVGMKHRLFWMHHEELEEGAAAEDPNTTSHSNPFEIEMTAALVSHIVRQGSYNPDDIAVLTPYLGQLQKLRERMAAESTFAVSLGERDMEDLEELDDPESERDDTELPKNTAVGKTTLLRSVRLATVDNFQGEEAKVVIISLVRSNPQNKCGFLSTFNRINVLMSRAKHGCYIIGNSNTYSNVPMWNQILQLLQDKGNFGTSLELQCPRHPDTPIRVSQPHHFVKFSPDAGCTLPCDRRLDCGHACYGPCHSELVHKGVKCTEKCPRPKKGCDHACPLLCGDPCQPRCGVELRGLNLELPCGHFVQSARCWDAQAPAAIRCNVQVARKVPGCDHTLLTAPTSSARLHVAKFCPVVTHAAVLVINATRAKRAELLDPTTGSASRFAVGSARRAHTLASGPVTARQDAAHARGPVRFAAATLVRLQLPSWKLHHALRRSLRLGSLLEAVHIAAELSTSVSFSYCQECGSEDVLSEEVDFLEMKEYREIDIDETPCIFPDCGHLLTVESMDGQMNIGEHYELDERGMPISIKSASKPFSMDEVKVCSKCRGSLRSISRYGRIVRRAMLDEATKKFISWCSNRHLELAERLLLEQQRLEQELMNGTEDVVQPGLLGLTGTAYEQIKNLRKWVGSGRYNKLLQTYAEIFKYMNQVRVEEQPFHKVSDFVRHANRNHKTQGTFIYDEDVIQLRGYLLAISLLLKCNAVILSDFLILWKGASMKPTNLSVDFSANLAQCEELIELAAATSRPQLQVEGHIYYAQFCGFSLSLGAPHQQSAGIAGISTEGDAGTGSATAATAAHEAESREHLRNKGLEHLENARSLLESANWGSKPLMEADIEAAANMLNGGVFYKTVTTDELRAVYEAMANEFRGTGHWYTCERGHPFTVGECGMPMEEARCPECGSPVGGRNHNPTAGVRRADDIEDLARGVGGMEI